MKKPHYFTLTLVLWLITTNSLGNPSDSLKHYFRIGYGLDLSDSYMGVYTKENKNNYSSFYSVQYSVSKGWYGGNVYFGIYKNTYKTNHIDNIYDFYFPNMVEGQIAGFNLSIFPVNSKNLGISVDLGLCYIKLNNLYCNSWEYIVINGQPKVLNARYIFDAESGFGFSYGISLSLPVYRNIRINPYFRVPEVRGIPVILAGCELNYNF